MVKRMFYDFNFKSNFKYRSLNKVIKKLLSVSVYKVNFFKMRNLKKKVNVYILSVFYAESLVIIFNNSNRNSSLTIMIL